ncbi:kinase-like protein, partial [Viridothelium virens]
MDRSHLVPGPGGMMKLKQAEEAKDMQKAVEERASRIGVEVPPYEFLELIGKGSFGRYSKDRRNQQIVAVKIIDVDSSDYKLDLKNKDEAIKDFVNEITILRQLKDSGAKNINGVLDTFSLHSQLWITAEYCPGGSVHTLMRANSKPGLEENYIIPIARELAVALRFVHEAGIIHRDVKCANVLVTEDGQVQLCDFGVSGVLDSDFSKRTTIIGTPFWMAPEMHKDEPSRLAYGTEVDCWAFGCTVYEMATGMPPNAKINPHMLGNVLDKAPRLQDGEYSDELRDFVSYCLQEQPQDRPSASATLDHPFVAATEEQYPTSSLVELIERYAQWEHQGGQRTSILNPFGAPGPESLSENGQVDEWNFSTTADFDKRIS